jgi:Mrp family chromosome partitioning ATPase
MAARATNAASLRVELHQNVTPVTTPEPRPAETPDDLRSQPLSVDASKNRAWCCSELSSANPFLKRELFQMNGREIVPEPHEQLSSVPLEPRTRVVFTKGGKGGVGKTGFMVNLAEWFLANEIPCTLLDLDTENKARGSLKHYFNETAHKVNIHTRCIGSRPCTRTWQFRALR